MCTSSNPTDDDGLATIETLSLSVSGKLEHLPGVGENEMVKYGVC